MKNVSTVENKKFAPESLFVVNMLNILSALSLIGGILMAAILWPGDAGDGYSWKTVAYLSSIISATAGIVQCILFAALAKIIMYLSKIEFNTRSSSGID